MTAMTTRNTKLTGERSPATAHRGGDLRDFDLGAAADGREPEEAEAFAERGPEEGIASTNT
jgi:hypothetical protein